MVPTRIRQWTSRLRAAPMWETLAATLSVMLLLGLAPPVPPIRWLLSGILISAAYAVTVAAIACFVNEYPKRALAWIATGIWVVLFMSSYGDFTGRDQYMWRFAMDVVGRRFFAWVWFVAPLFVGMSVAHPKASRMHVASWVFFCTILLVMTFIVCCIPSMMLTERYWILDHVQDWSIPVLVVLALGPFGLAYGMSGNVRMGLPTSVSADAKR